MKSGWDVKPTNDLSSLVSEGHTWSRIQSSMSMDRLCTPHTCLHMHHFLHLNFRFAVTCSGKGWSVSVLCGLQSERGLMSASQAVTRLQGTPSQCSDCRRMQSHRATAGWERLDGGCTSPRVIIFVVSWGDTRYCVMVTQVERQLCCEQHTLRCTQTSGAACLVMGKNEGGETRMRKTALRNVGSILWFF